MSAQKVPVTFLSGHSAWKGLLGLVTFPDMLADRETSYCRFFTYNEGQWGRGREDFPFDCTSLTYLIDESVGYKAWWLLGKNGEAVEVKGGIPRIEKIPGAGLGGSKRYGYVSTIKNIAGQLYVCGYRRQVYRRDSAWTSIADNLLARERGRGFFDIDGTSRSCIYAVGWHGEIYFYDSTAWQKDDSPTDAHLAAVRCVGEDDVWICGNGGLVLHGSFNNWRAIRDDAFTGNWYSIEEFAGRIYLAGNGELAVVDGDRIRPVDVGLGKEVTTNRLHAKDGLLWSIGEKDILVFDGKSWVEVLHPDNS